jgi:hypothetical protein
VAKIQNWTILFALEIAAVSSFIWRELALGPWGVSQRPLSFSLLSLAGLLVVLGIILSAILRVYVAYLVSRTKGEALELEKAVLSTFSPSLLLPLIFLQEFIYLNDIDLDLLVACCLACVYLQVVLLARLKRAHPEAILVGKIWTGLTLKGLDTRRLSRRLFFITLAVYVLYLSGRVVPAQPFTGDEPHYLLVTKSLVSDGDINLYNNYQNKDYLRFYPGGLDSHAYPGKKGERYLYSKHFPALPALLVPSYFLGAKLGRLVFGSRGMASREREILVFFSRLPLCFLTAFLSAGFFLFVCGIAKNRSVATLSWFVFSFTSPVLFFSHLLYPEIPVALILLLIAYQIVHKKNLSARSLFGAGAGLALLPWFGLKYIPLAGVVFLGILFLFLKSAEKDQKKRFAFLAPIAVSAGLFVISLWSMYGTISPQTVYKGTAAAERFPLSSFLVADFLTFFRRLLGLFFDQRAGLFVYAPVYVLCLAGVFLLAKRIKEEALLLGGFALVFWLFCSLTEYWGGYCPPGRPLLPVSWILALFAAGAFAVGQSKVFLAVRNTLILLSFLLVFVFVRNPRLLYHESLSSLAYNSHREVFSNLLTLYSNIFIAWRKLVPSLSNSFREDINWTPLVVWLPLVVGISTLLLKRYKPEPRESRLLSPRVHVALAIAISVFLIANAFFNIRLENRCVFEGQDYEVFFQDENTYGQEMEGFWVKGKRNTALILKTAKPASAIHLDLSCPAEGKTTIRLSGRTKRAERNSRAGFEQKISFLSPRGFRWRGGFLYRLRIEESSGFYPFRRDANSQDNRFLGVYVKIDASFLPR